MNARARSVVAHTIASYVAVAVIIYHLFPRVQIPPGPAPLIVKILVTAACCMLAPVLVPPFLIAATVACVVNSHYRTVWVSVDWVAYLGALFIATEMLKAAYRRE